MITGLHSITLWTENIEPLSRFYHDLLGLQLQTTRTDFTNFQLGQARLNLYRNDQVHGPSKDPYRVMIHLAVDDVQQEYQRLTQEGVEFVRAPFQEKNGAWVATLQDPDGNVLQMFQAPS